MLGTWEIAKMKSQACLKRLPTAAAKTQKNLRREIPPGSVLRQADRGTLSIIKRRFRTEEGRQHVVAMLHQPLPKQGKKWEIVSITPIV